MQDNIHYTVYPLMKKRTSILKRKKCKYNASTIKYLLSFFAVGLFCFSTFHSEYSVLHKKLHLFNDYWT